MRQAANTALAGVHSEPSSPEALGEGLAPAIDACMPGHVPALAGRGRDMPHSAEGSIPDAAWCFQHRSSAQPECDPEPSSSHYAADASTHLQPDCRLHSAHSELADLDIDEDPYSIPQWESLVGHEAASGELTTNALDQAFEQLVDQDAAVTQHHEERLHPHPAQDSTSLRAQDGAESDLDFAPLYEKEGSGEESADGAVLPPVAGHLTGKRRHFGVQPTNVEGMSAPHEARDIATIVATDARTATAAQAQVHSVRQVSGQEADLSAEQVSKRAYMGHAWGDMPQR